MEEGEKERRREGRGSTAADGGAFGWLSCHLLAMVHGKDEGNDASSYFETFERKEGGFGRKEKESYLFGPRLRHARGTRLPHKSPVYLSGADWRKSDMG